MLCIAVVFAGGFAAILIGPIVESLISRNIEFVTGRRWGTRSQR